jgi:geranylgeranyl diphosphate synthase type I
VVELRAIITGTGALARTERRIADLTRQALDALDGVELDPEAAGVLVELARAATQRAD